MALISQIYFWNKTVYVSDSSSVNHQEFFSLYTQKWHMSYRFADSLPASCQQTCPKHIEFYSKNKFE